MRLSQVLLPPEQIPPPVLPQFQSPRLVLPQQVIERPSLPEDPFRDSPETFAVAREEPAFRLKWYRQIPNTHYPFDSSTFDRPRIYFLLGDRESGKSAFLEDIGIMYRNRGHKIFDIWSSSDNEGLAWLRSPLTKNITDKILLFHGPSVQLSFDKVNYETRVCSEITDSDFEYYDFILTSPRFFPLIDWTERYEQMALLIRRLLTYRDHYDKINYVIMREASEILYSRLKAWANIEETKAQIVQLINKCRHAGIAMALDTQRSMDVDKAVRDACDFKIFKRPDYNGLPSDLHWMYDFVRPEKLTGLNADQFVMLARDGSIAEGQNTYPPWHKEEKEDLLTEVGIHITYVEAPHADEVKNGVMTLGDGSHAKIMRYWIRESLNMPKIKLMFDREYAQLGLKTRISTETIARHIDWHNKDIESADKICSRCRRVKSDLAKIPAAKRDSKDKGSDVV